MPYAITGKDKTVRHMVRRIAAERADASLRVLEDASVAPEKRIHEIRKNVKKVRALLRLVRPVFPGFASENAALREAGRAVSGLRDSAVIAATLRALAADASLSPAEERHALALAEAIAGPRTPANHDPALETFRDAMAALGERLKGWQIEGDGFDAIRPGLEATWTRARHAARAAARHETHDSVHEWRKRVKDHWYHATLLRNLWPDMMAPHIAAADDLGETLGLAGDMAMTAAHVTAESDDPASRRLATLAAARRAAHLAAARRMHDQLFAETAERLADRWEVWWSVWRRGG